MKLLLPLVFIMPLVSISQPPEPKIVDLDKVAFRILKVGVKPDFIATDQDDAWVIDDHQSRIIKISAERKAPLLVVHVPDACTAPILGFSAIWVMSCSEKCLYKIDHLKGNILARIPTGMADEQGEMSLAVGDGSVWLLSDSTGVLARIDPATNSVLRKIVVKPHSFCVAFGHHSAWVTNYHDNSVQRIDPATNSVVATIPVGAKPRFITAGGKGVCTLNQGDGTVSRIDPLSNKTFATINVEAVGGGGDIASDTAGIWVSSTNTKRPILTINELSNTIETVYRQNTADKKMFKVDGAVRVSKNYIWVSGYYSKTVWVLKRHM